MDTHILQISTTGRNPWVSHVQRSFDAAWRGEGKLDAGVLAIEGMSGRKYRQFINMLVAGAASPRYLEIGSWAGSTLCSAIQGNDVTAMAIDNWSEFGGPSGMFLQNLSQFRGSKSRVSFLERDFRTIDYQTIGSFNIFLFDGPHAEVDQYDGLCMPQPALDDQHVLIVDDWNFRTVRDGTHRALAERGHRVDWATEIRTTLDDSHPLHGRQHSDWHNGYFIAALTKAAT